MNQEPQTRGLRTVLIVEDERTLAKNIDQFLAGKGFHTTMAFSAAEALQALCAEPVDVVLLDINLPDQDGLDLCQYLRAQFPRLRMIAMSGRACSKQRARARGLGINAYMTKPFPLAYLLAEINQLAGDSRTPINNT